MPKIAGLVGLLMVACLFGVSHAHSASASDPPTMRLDPASIKIQGVIGATFTVDVRIEGVTDLGGFTFEIPYDDSSLDLTGIREGPFLSSGGGDPVCFKSNLPGVGRLGCLLLGKEFAANGSGTIAHLDFSLAIPFFTTSQLQLILLACDAADTQGSPIALNGCKDGIVEINPAPTATPTPTPAAVGGVSQDPDVGALTNTAVPSRGGDAWVEIVLAVAGGLALVAGGWLARRWVGAHRSKT